MTEKMAMAGIPNLEKISFEDSETAVIQLKSVNVPLSRAGRCVVGVRNTPKEPQQWKNFRRSAKG